ncbi:putative mitochondrial ATP-dependent helicase irc3 [Hypsizygus marmoreus]|uniref:Mitochondrial ATP-dependent helicase irc3 n=1 Tax=Hypsizygus marmoreus TaxID=39966 RepID=A0A369JHS7_HYPMA|nr:putative mitochondrial ATP-dependent helicase irc3 [Hypsizygus marmoreus]
MSVFLRPLFRRAEKKFLGNLPFLLATHTPPYQERTLDACLDGLKSGTTRLNISLPNYHGKSIFIVNLLSRMPSPALNSSATRSLVIVDSTTAMERLAVHFAVLSPSSTIGLEDGNDNKCRGTCNIVIATSGTLRSKARLGKFDLSKLKAVIIDVDPEALDDRLLSHFQPELKRRRSKKTKPQIPPHQIAIIGLSPSDLPHIANEASGSIYQCTMHPHSMLEEMQEQWSCEPRFISIVAEMDLRRVPEDHETADFRATSLAVAINKPTVNTSIVEAWSDHAATRKSTVVFCLDATHAEALACAYETRGFAARWISPETPVETLNDIIADFKSGVLRVLITCDILFQDADIPNIDCVVIARPTLSRNTFAQMIRYGMQCSPDTGKENCLVMDLVDSAPRKPGIICTATMFGLDPTEVAIKDESAESLKELARKVMSIPPKVPPYETSDNPFSLVDGATGDPRLAELSENAWVACGDDHYSLRCFEMGTVTIYPVNTDKASAIRDCEEYVTKEITVAGERVGSAIPRSAEWRTEPATPTQKNAIFKSLVKWSELYDPFALIAGVETVFDMTRGEASNIITRLKAGAMRRYERKRRAAILQDESTQGQDCRML